MEEREVDVKTVGTFQYHLPLTRVCYFVKLTMIKVYPLKKSIQICTLWLIK